MNFLEDLILMVLLSAARDQVRAHKLLGLPFPEGYSYVWGAVVWHAKPPEWVDGLWEETKES